MTVYWFGFVMGAVAILTLRAAIHGDWEAVASGLMALTGVAVIFYGVQTQPTKVIEGERE